MITDIDESAWKTLLASEASERPFQTTAILYKMSADLHGSGWSVSFSGHFYCKDVEARRLDLFAVR
jgi:hypothetical protein